MSEAPRIPLQAMSRLVRAVQGTGTPSPVPHGFTVVQRLWVGAGAAVLGLSKSPERRAPGELLPGGGSGWLCMSDSGILGGFSALY